MLPLPRGLCRLEGACVVVPGWQVYNPRGPVVLLSLALEGTRGPCPQHLSNPAPSLAAPRHGGVGAPWLLPYSHVTSRDLPLARLSPPGCLLPFLCPGEEPRNFAIALYPSPPKRRLCHFCDQKAGGEPRVGGGGLRSLVSPVAGAASRVPQSGPGEAAPARGSAWSLLLGAWGPTLLAGGGPCRCLRG